MAADLPDTDLAHLRRWCGQRIPAHAQHQVRLEHQIHAHTVTITKRRAPWDPDDGSEWTSRPLAQLRHSLHGWRLYWADSNSRWHLIHDVPTATDVTPPLKVIDDPGQPPFLG
jgi:malate synthase